MATATTDQQSTAPPEEAASSTPARAPRIRVGALVSATSALALLIIMFATEWYGVAGVPDPSAVRPAVSTAENAWHGLTVTRWVLLATIVASIGAVVLHASQREHGNKTDTSLIVAALARSARCCSSGACSSCCRRPTGSSIRSWAPSSGCSARSGSLGAGMRRSVSSAPACAQPARAARTIVVRAYPGDAPACSLLATSGKEVRRRASVDDEHIVRIRTIGDHQ